MAPFDSSTANGAQRPIDAPIGSSMYGRLFPDLPSFSDPTSVRHAPESWTPSAALIDLLIGLE
jgi:hypothetical protein